MDSKLEKPGALAPGFSVWTFLHAAVWNARRLTFDLTAAAPPISRSSASAFQRMLKDRNKSPGAKVLGLFRVYPILSDTRSLLNGSDAPGKRHLEGIVRQLSVRLHVGQRVS